MCTVSAILCPSSTANRIDLQGVLNIHVHIKKGSLRRLTMERKYLPPARANIHATNAQDVEVEAKMPLTN